jgi:hypothetical protein
MIIAMDARGNYEQGVLRTAVAMGVANVLWDLLGLSRPTPWAVVFCVVYVWSALEFIFWPVRRSTHPNK